MTAELYFYQLVDVADEINIPKLKQKIKKLQLRPLKLNYFTPAYLNLTIPPVETKERSWFILPEKIPVSTSAKFYSLGSVAIKYKIEIMGKDYEEILKVAGKVANNRSVFEQKTKRITKKSRELLEKQLDIKTYKGFEEDYAILWIKNKYNSGVIDSRAKNCIARFLRNESAVLSEYEQNEALKYRFSYSPEDLTIVDWDRALTIGEKSDDDVWDVLEYANLQLLELRYYESELDRQLKEIYEFSKTKRLSIIKYYQTHKMLQKTLEIFIDFTSVEKRINNFLRLTGDEYLSRIYIAASKRMNMIKTQENLKERLLDTKELYEMLSAEASAIRTEILEIIIILLITFEIIYAFF